MKIVKKNITSYLKLFKRYYPEAHCALDHKTPEQLLIATVLSAQCTDERVNLVTKSLFRSYPSPKELAEADIQQLEAIVHPTGFFKVKSKNIKKLSEILVAKNNAKVFKTLDELMTLPGVGRKTANVVLGNAFGLATGVAVDTHVSRLSRRLGLSHSKTAEKIEVDLQGIVPKKHWIQFSHWLIWHGRKVCKARKPQCSVCFLDSICPKNK
jgi:endonuclease-3